MRIPVRMTMMDGSSPKRHITQVATITVRVGDQLFTEDFLISDLPSAMVFGYWWLHKYNPCIDWQRLSIDGFRAAQPASIRALLSDVSPQRQEKNGTDWQKPIALGPSTNPEAAFSAGGVLSAIEAEQARREINAEQALCLLEAKSAICTLLDTVTEVRAMTASVNGLTKNAANWLDTIPESFRKYAHTVFSDESAANLPPSRPGLDCEIRVKDGHKLSTCKIYDMSKEQLDTLKAIIDEQLAKGFIRPSTSSASSPVFFVKDKASSSRGVEQLRLVVDYRALNSHIEMDEYPIPLIRTVMERLPKAKYFTKFDVRAGFNNIRIKPGDEWKTAFKTMFGLYEYTVMPFGLATAPSVFQRFINHVLGPYLDVFCFAYLDDIIIFSNSKEEHMEHVDKVLSALAKNDLHLKPSKCVWITQEVSFLGFTAVAGKGIRMSDDKLQALREWKRPTSVKEVRMFLGTVNFYHDFIPHYSDLVSPLTDLTKKNVQFRWGDTEENAWLRLMGLLRNDVFLAPFDPSYRTILETDASDVAYAGVISQEQPNGKIKPVLMYSHKFQDSEKRWTVAEKELFAIIFGLKRYPHYLHGKFPVQVYSDHRNLSRFMTATKLTGRLGRWYDDITRLGIDFQIQYRPGEDNVVADALSRYGLDSDDSPKYDCILPEHRFSPKALQDIKGMRARILGHNPMDKTEPTVKLSRPVHKFISHLGLLDLGTRKVPISEIDDLLLGMISGIIHMIDDLTREEILSSTGYPNGWEPPHPISRKKTGKKRPRRNFGAFAGGFLERYLQVLEKKSDPSTRLETSWEYVARTASSHGNRTGIGGNRKSRYR